MWVSEKMFRIINESNMDCLVEICTSDPTDESISDRYLKLVSAVKVDNLFENRNTRNSPHLLRDKRALAGCDVLDRLIR